MNNLNSETYRFKTFESFEQSFPSKCTLALAGFSFIAHRDTVQCHFCKVTISSWKRNDDVLLNHFRWSPHCPLILGQKTENIPANMRLFGLLIDQMLRQNRCDGNACPHTSLMATASYSSLFPTYLSEYKRIQSYAMWTSEKKSPIDLAAAGFFYMFNGDCVKCFTCGVSIRNWHEDHDSWKEHALNSSKCPFLLQEKGENFVKSVIHEAEEQRTAKKKNIIDISCKVCLKENYKTLFLPCNHVVACFDCAIKLKKCPICRHEILKFIVVYLT